MRELSKMRVLLLAIVILLLGLSSPAFAARVKDIADVEGVRGNQLYGYGLVIGLNGTGDGIMVNFTTKTISNLLEREGLSVDAQGLMLRNVASVMVTATLPAFSRPGSRLDVTISSVGDAKSLQGGTLLMTPLKGADGNIYAAAQGAVTVGGYSVEAGGDAAVKNHPTVGHISLGATVERSIPFDLFQSQRIRVVLRSADFTTMTRLVERINTELGRPIAVAVDSASVEIPLIEEYRVDPIGFVAKLEQLSIETDIPARVVINEKTGTIVMGESVTVSTVALAHGNLSIAIRAENQVSQPGALAEVGETQVVTNTDITVGEEQSGLSIVGGEVTLGELVNALNSLGATPRDLISIFTALQRSGALRADLVVM